MFGIPQDDLLTLQRTKFKVNKLLDNNNAGIISHNNPITPRHKINYVLLPQGHSRTLILKRFRLSNVLLTTTMEMMSMQMIIL